MDLGFEPRQLALKYSTLNAMKSLLESKVINEADQANKQRQVITVVDLKMNSLDTAHCTQHV